jgi:hypothetical protein
MGGLFEVTGFIGYINYDEGLGAFAKIKCEKRLLTLPCLPSVHPSAWNN